MNAQDRYPRNAPPQKLFSCGDCGEVCSGTRFGGQFWWICIVCFNRLRDGGDLTQEGIKRNEPARNGIPRV